MTRHIKQLITGTFGHSEFISYELIALCDDDTIWLFKEGDKDRWVQMPEIPQPESDASLTYAKLNGDI